MALAAAAAFAAAAAPVAHAAAPDLVLRKATAPKQIVTGRPFTVNATVAARTRAPATTATLTVSAAGTGLASKPLRLRAGQKRVVVKLPVTLASAGATRLDVAVTATHPAERATRNSTRHLTVGVADFQIYPRSIVTPAFTGYGAQFNHHVYAQLSRDVGVTEQNVGDMERKMRDLHPQFSRIFFHPSAFDDPDRMQSFVRTVLLAQSAGSTIDVTWQGGRLDVASGTVQKFANVLIDLVRNRGVTRLRWLTLQNEPNRTRITPAQYEAEYRELDPYVQSIRGQVKYMVGDLVRGPDTGVPNQQVWFTFLATHMSDILDAYSIHVFWDYWDTKKPLDRLTEVRAIWDKLPQPAKKPLYVSEYGVRGWRTFNGVQQVHPGVWEDGTTPITATNVSAFQHAWFDLLAAKLGYLGTSKWDSYFGKYDRGTQAYYMIGSPASGWPTFPIYNVMRLLTAAVRPGSRVVRVDAIPETTRVVAAFATAGVRMIVGLDFAGARLNTASSTQVSYTIGGFQPLRPLDLTVWNAAGDGATGPATRIVADAAGVATFAVPQQALFALRAPAGRA
jgi:hypothetical protein